MSTLEAKIQTERCMVWQFKRLLVEQTENKAACEKIQCILEKHESLLLHYQQWSVVEVQS